jgi:hypothetical protein
MSYTKETIEFLRELSKHSGDHPRPEEFKERYERFLRDPTREFARKLRERFIRPLESDVKYGICKPTDRWHEWRPHYVFAFYDPRCASWNHSQVQLFFYLDSGKESGKEQWYYGFSLSRERPGEHVERFNKAIHDATAAIAQYFRTAPPDTIVELSDDGEKWYELSPAEFVERLEAGAGVADAPFGTCCGINVQSVYNDLDSLLNHADRLAEEVGGFFTWAWPLFEASLTGKWCNGPLPPQPPSALTLPAKELESPATGLEELCRETSLSIQLLDELQEALLAKQQVVLVGPPGTSKTFLANAFGRYFVQKRGGHAEGKCNTLYMHASWTYEDFFEGIRPATADGGLCFEPKKGYFLKWVESLPSDPASRHVLVLDEINRCDTAAVLGELLQLLEYRGVEVGLLSGSPFTLPRNLYVIGTMNSADRSIGRMDLALRRRFLWVNLYPDPDILGRWLDRPGNNPVGFDANALAECNAELEQHEIPPTQHVGHALFMGLPLTERHLTRIVRFSVIPYIQELLFSQYGKGDQELCDSIESILLGCVERGGSSGEPLDGAMGRD